MEWLINSFALTIIMLCEPQQQALQGWDPSCHVDIVAYYCHKAHFTSDTIWPLLS